MNGEHEQDQGVCQGVAASPEKWRPIVGYDALYMVSSLGRVRNASGRVLSTRGTDKDGYPVVSLSVNGRRHTYTLHRLVCRAFHGPPNALHREAAHLDGDRSNARASNLKWVGTVENEHHKRRHGTSQIGEGNPFAKLSEADVLVIRSRAQKGEAATAISRDFPTTRHAIQKIVNRRTWHHVQ